VDGEEGAGQRRHGAFVIGDLDGPRAS
jgi:hypothetical protein